ncbi:MAG: periplasmic heavy metal sensor [Proteobacteria bacterium]|nr:periplasmic heavy metal sensor [Pseudomonadota bacterium]
MSERTFPWRTLLFVSVAFNLLIVGAAVGALGAGVRLERQPAIGARFPAPREFMAALPPETQAKVREELVRTWVQIRPLRQQAAQARREAFDAAATEPFDAARVRAAFARVRATDEAALAAFHENVIAAFAQMTPEERRRAIVALRNAVPRRQALGPVARAVGAEAAEQQAPPTQTAPR